MTTLIIARHGNTFGPGDTPTRVGGRTDLPLVEKGFEQGKAIGRHLKENRLIPDVVYASNLKRTLQTAETAIKESGVSNPIFQLDMFNEIECHNVWEVISSFVGTETEGQLGVNLLLF